MILDDGKGGFVEVPSAPSIYARLAAAALSMQAIPKRGKNPEEGYAFALVEDVVTAARAALFAQGLVIVPSVLSANAEQLPEKKYSRLTHVRVSYRVVAIDTGEHLDIEWCGQGFDAGDKGASKAYTACLKYMLINLLLIPIGDDPEADGTTDKDVRRAERRSEADTKAYIERPGETWKPSPPRFDPWEHERSLYDVRCARLGMTGRGSGAARAEVIAAVCGEKVARKNLTLVQLKAVNDELLRRALEREEAKEAGAQRTDSPADAEHGGVVASAAPEPLYSAVEDGDDTAEPVVAPGEVNGGTADALDEPRAELEQSIREAFESRADEVIEIAAEMADRPEGGDVPKAAFIEAHEELATEGTTDTTKEWEEEWPPR